MKKVEAIALGAIVVAGLVHLALNLKQVQVDATSAFRYDGARQSVRRVQIGGVRGRILARDGRVLAGNRNCLSLAVQAARYQRRSWEATVVEIEKALAVAAAKIGRRPSVGLADIRRHVRQSLAMPLVAWRNLSEREIAVFFEHERELPGFFTVEDAERTYPERTFAAHLVGYVGRDRGDSVAGDEKFNFFSPELRGRSGLEAFYDGYLRGVPGERKVRVDARGFATEEWTVVEPQGGPDLVLSLDLDLQRVAERQLAGLKGACVVIDPRNGEVLALVSAPGFNPNDFVPRLDPALYARYAEDPAKPLLNRAVGGAYAPGSTFKPVTALAGLRMGYPERQRYCCEGVIDVSGMQLRCTRRWGHGELDLRHALMMSCNPFFANLGLDIGTNALVTAAHDFGLGEKTGIDFGVDMAGVVPEGEWKLRTYREKWYAGDLAQMSIGQGMLLVSPLQMALVAGAIGTGYRVRPHLRRDLQVEKKPLKFSAAALKAVREGMRMVVAGDGVTAGTGWRGGEGVSVAVSGKTGTAEVGMGANRRKNTWFIAYAPSDAPRVAVAMVVENGESGGGTTAPKVAEILKEAFR